MLNGYLGDVWRDSQHFHPLLENHEHAVGVDVEIYMGAHVSDSQAHLLMNQICKISDIVSIY